MSFQHHLPEYNFVLVTDSSNCIYFQFSISNIAQYKYLSEPSNLHFIRKIIRHEWSDNNLRLVVKLLNDCCLSNHFSRPEASKEQICKDIK